MELLGRELGTHWADFGNVEPNPNRTMPWSGRRLLSTRLLTRARACLLPSAAPWSSGPEQASVDLSTLAQDCRSASEPETVSTGCYEPVQDAPSARSAALLDRAGSRSDLLLARRAENRC